MFHIIEIQKGFQYLCKTRGLTFDNRELDVFECIKFICFCMGTISYTTYLTISTQADNPWVIVSFFEMMVFTNFCGFAIVMEMFFAISCFYFSYRLFQLAEVNGDKLHPLDVLKAFARKLLRLVPVYWAIFFLSWGMYPRSTNGGPFWYVSANLFESCNDDWWARILLIGNLVPEFTSQAPICGCFFWGWIIDVDIQLTLVVPLFVYAYLFNKKLGHAMIFIFIIFGMFVNMAIVNAWDIKVGWLAT